ncbi:VWA domain-containing protein, partial [Rhizobium sp. CRIBSB]|nr:VWA domain-containing protein [Rhizobium sp. CRIBSB]
LNNAFSITITDDVPVLSGTKENRTVDEDDIATSQSTGTSPDDDNTVDGSYTGNPISNTTGPAFISGSLGNLIKGGADDTVKFSFIDEGVLRQSLAGLGMSSKGEVLSFDLQGNVLYGFANVGGPSGVSFDPQLGDRPVFKLTLNENGSYTFELIDQLDHDLGAGQNTGLQGSDANAINFGAVIQATDHDGDSVSLNNAFSITITDDVPVLSGTKENRLVDEDDIKTSQSTGTNPTDGNGDGSWTGGPGQNGNGPAFIDGSLANLIKGGADDRVKFSFIDESAARAALDNLGLSSKGAELSYDIRDGVLYAFDNAGPFKGESFDADNGDRLVFKLTLNDNGSYTFELVDQLDHDLGKGQNTDLQDDFWNKDVEAIDFGSIIKATDFDGDSVSLGGAFSITIRDDVPELSGSKETRIVDEDDIRTRQSTGNNPNDGDADGSFTGNPIGNNAGPAFVSGSLANLIKGGADDTVKFSFISETAAVSALAALGLSSKGAELSYDIQGKTLFAYDNDAGNSGYGHGDRLVFKLTLEDNGSYTFELVDQLDHDRPKFGRDENTDLQDEVLGDVEAIDFGSIIKATDFDGDSVVLTNAFSITIRDDVPELSGKTDARIVDEDDIKTSQSTGTSPADFDADGSWTGGPGQGGNGPAFIDGSLACLVKGGADDTIKFSFIDETVARIALSALGLKSQGEALSYQIQGNSLIAYDNNGGPGYGQGDRLVFKLTLNQNGDYTFELADQLDHDRPAFGADENYDLQDGLWFADIAAINFGALIKATDNDGDSISLNGVFEIKIRDDIPEASIVTDQTVTIDETNGNQNSDTTDQAVAAVFAGVSNPASDLDMQQSPIFAKADVIDTTFKSGTDEGVTTTLALRIDNAASGLQTTAGQDITLYLENGLVVGRVGGPQGQAAFAIAIDADGNVSVAQYTSLKHPDTTAADEGIDLTGKLSAVFTVKDFDGDVVTKSVSIGNKIAFEDDAPVATGEQASVREADPASGGNLVFAFDVSGSMRDRIGGPGGDTRLQVAKDAAINLINATNAGLVLIVTFAGSASASQWMTKEDALDFIQNDIPNPNGGTDYDDAIDAIKDVTPPSAPTSVYFFSDGEVTGTDRLTGQDRQQWEAYLNQNDMKSYAVGVGNDIDSQDEDLRDVAWPGEPILITSPTDPILLATVVAPVPTTASGNVLENDSFGADGVRIQSITIGGVTYTWDGNATITKSGSETGEISGFSMTVASPLGGSFTFDFKTGAWSYAAPSELVINSSESFNYILVDGDGDTTQAALTINLEAVNDAPVNTVPSSLTVAEDVELAITGLQVGDVDANGGNLTVKLEVEDGKLTLATSDGVTVAGNNSDTVTLTGSVSAINAALAGLKYKGDLNFNGADQLKITTTDNGNSGVGGAKTDTDTVNITVTPVNDAPLLSPETRTIEFTENGNGRYLFSNVNVSDVDKPSNFNGGTIEISLGNTAVAGDQIFSDGWSRVSGGNVQIATFGGWVTIGTLVSGGLGGTSIKINLTSGATEDRVEFFLETIAYKSTSENPTDADRTVTVTFSDGGNTGAGGSQSDTSMITVKVNPVNDAPVVANAIADQSIQEEGTVNFTVPANAFTDVDSAPLSYTATLVNGNALPSWLTFNAATRTFSGTAPLDYNGAIDVKVTASDGSLSVSDTFKLTVTPVNDAPVVANAIADQSIQEEGTVNFTVPANAFTDVDSAPLSYTATLDNGNALPSWLTFNAATRTFSGTAPLNYNGAIDVKVTASDGSLSVSDTFKLTVNPVNDAPVLSDVGGTLAYTEGDGGKVVDGSITITDIDDANIEGATVKITGNFASGQDVLLFTNQNGISGSYDASNGTLTLSGASSKANYELALESIRYQNTSDNPSSAARTISFSVTDGEATSNIGTVSVSVTPTASKIEGNEFDNTLSGTTGNDTILGYEGDDDISGGHGNDILAGGLGWDTVSGGNGSDTFILDGSSLAYDVITDFVSAADILNFVSFSLANHSGTGAINSVVTINGNGNLGNSGSDTSIAGADLVVLNVNAQDANNASEINAILDGQRGTFNGGVFVLAYAVYDGANRVALYYDGDADGTSTGARLVAIFPNYNSVTTNGVPNIAADFASISNIADPIILDLDKNGFAFSSIDNGVTFDIDADGKADQIAWTSDDGILAYDANGNGTIDDGSEIFTPDFNGGKFASGVAALASLDSNGDGKIDASDEAFSKLQVWMDADNDGVSDQGELSSLSANGVASISLTTDQTGGTEDDQTIFAEGEFTFADGSTGNFVEVGFDTIFGSDLTDGLTVIGTDGDDVLHGGMGQVIMTGGAGADTFVFDGTALDELDVADVITDFNSDEGDVLDVTALLDSLLGEQATAETAASHLRATVEDGNTTVSVQTATDTWKDVVTLQGHTESVKILFDDKHAVTVPHD